MSSSSFEDYYEILQVSPRVDPETLGSVFRYFAKRFHPDNPDTGDENRFRRVVDAYNVLSDPESRARYDVRHEQIRETRWRIFEPDAVETDVDADRRVRLAILSLLYTARRNDAERPGMGVVDLERILGCPAEHMKFHVWYLKENGWIQRLEDGQWAVTATGVDKVMDLGGPSNGAALRLAAGRPGDAAEANGTPGARVRTRSAAD
jgi:hypothetical protein